MCIGIFRLFILIMIFQITAVPRIFSQNSHRYMRTDYQYDLVSNKVNVVKYQDGRQDQLFHKYAYDGDNRITHVYTSTDNITWKLEAKYFYYDHGPLMRVEIGKGIQGVDFAYTLQGWIKGTNSNTLAPGRDIGKDGETGLHRHFAKDVAGYSVGYFQGDYAAINVAPGDAFVAGTVNSELNAQNLYDGNISHTVAAIGKFMGNDGPPRGVSYTYDQLNRLKAAVQHIDPNLTVTNAWASGTATEDYKEEYAYDANGNIASLTRNAYGENKAMDQFTYTYENKVNGYERNTNKLRHVTDAVGTNTWDDIENQESDNYSYDEIGNLIKDNTEGILSISWTVSGKIKQINKQNGTVVTFDYDAAGNRVSKNVRSETDDRTTYYVGDGRGNVMAVYQTNNGQLELREQTIYGRERLGQRNEIVTLGNADNTSSTRQFFTGSQDYEFSNYLGNVLAVVNDERKPLQDPVTGLVKSYEATVISANDYYTFGAPKPGLSFNSGNYRYGFNGIEKDDEVKGIGNSYGAEFRHLDPRLGKWISLDPKMAKYPSISPFVAFNNNPVYWTDPYGDDPPNDSPSGGTGPTVMEAAAIAEHVYGSEVKTVGNTGWKVSSLMKTMTDVVWEKSETGFKSGLYERTVDGVTEYVYATAGTNDVKDANTDIKQALGWVEKQYPQSRDNAILIAKALKGKSLTYVGHSLGGGLASANSLTTGHSAITFNAAALNSKTKKDLGLTKIGKIDAYMVIGEIVDDLQRQVLHIRAEGEIHELLPPDGYGYNFIMHLEKGYKQTDPVTLAKMEAQNLKNSVMNHLMSNVIAALKEAGYK